MIDVQCWRWKAVIGVQGWPSHRETLTLPWWEEGSEPQSPFFCLSCFQGHMTISFHIHTYWRISYHISTHEVFQTVSLFGSVKRPTDLKLTTDMHWMWQLKGIHAYKIRRLGPPDFLYKKIMSTIQTLRNMRSLFNPTPPTTPALKRFFLQRLELKTFLVEGLGHYFKICLENCHVSCAASACAFFGSTSFGWHWDMETGGAKAYWSSWEMRFGDSLVFSWSLLSQKAFLSESQYH